MHVNVGISVLYYFINPRRRVAANNETMFPQFVLVFSFTLSSGSLHQPFIACKAVLTVPYLHVLFGSVSAQSTASYTGKLSTLSCMEEYTDPPTYPQSQVLIVLTTGQNNMTKWPQNML